MGDQTWNVPHDLDPLKTLFLCNELIMPTIESPLKRGLGRGFQRGRTSVVGGTSTFVACDLSDRPWPATSEAEAIRFNMINPKTNNRIRMQTVDAGTGEQVSRSW
jgi:hypothetical protein